MSERAIKKDVESKKKSKKKRKRDSLSETDRAKLELKRQRDRLKKCRIKCETMIAKELHAAKDLMKMKKKKQAIILLKKKKLKEKMLSDTENKLLTIETLLSQIDEAELTAETMIAMKQGTEALKALNEEMSLEDVERIMDETQEAIEYQQEVDELLSGKLGSDDEDAVELEFLRMLALEEALAEEADGARTDEVVLEAPDLPDVPQKKVIIEEKGADEVVKEKKAEVLLQ